VLLVAIPCVFVVAFLICVCVFRSVVFYTLINASVFHRLYWFMLLLLVLLLLFLFALSLPSTYVLFFCHNVLFTQFCCCWVSPVPEMLLHFACFSLLGAEKKCNFSEREFF
jgi:hypothetical protein